MQAAITQAATLQAALVEWVISEAYPSAEPHTRRAIPDKLD